MFLSSVHFTDTIRIFALFAQFSVFIPCYSIFSLVTFGCLLCACACLFRWMIVQGVCNSLLSKEEKRTFLLKKKNTDALFLKIRWNSTLVGSKNLTLLFLFCLFASVYNFIQAWNLSIVTMRHFVMNCSWLQITWQYYWI